LLTALQVYVMNKHTVLLLFFILSVLVGQVLGESGPPIYVSAFTLTGDGQILKIDGTTGATTTVYKSSGFFPEDITVGPDNKVYVCDPTKGQIVRMEQDGTKVQTVYPQPNSHLSELPGGPQGPRFNSAGTLFFNTKGSGANGVWKIEGLIGLTGPPFPDPVKVLPTNQSGEGLAFTINGDLLIANRSLTLGGGAVRLSPGPLFASDKTSTIINKLYDPIGIARNGAGDIFVARAGSPYDIQRFTVTPTGVSSSTSVKFDAPDQPFYLEFTFDGTLFVATATANASIPSGNVWKITPPVPPNTVVPKEPLASFAIDQQAVGVGRPATSLSITKTFSGTQAYDFGPNSFELTAGTLTAPCTATITARQKPPAEVNQMLQDSCTMQGSCVAGTVQTMSGDEGFATTWLVEPDLVKGCPTATDGNYGVAILGFVGAPFGISPGIVKCSLPTGEQAGPSSPVCVKQQDFGYYPEATSLRGFGDPVIVTKSRSFSEYLFVNLNLDLTPGQNVYFCGPLSPLNSDPKKPAVFSIGQTIPIKFQLRTGSNCTGGFITDANAVASAAQIRLENGTNTFIRRVITPAGSANDPPTFRYDSVSNLYVFNLKTSKATGWKPGLHQLIVTSNKFFPQKPPPNQILFQLQ